MNAGEAKRLIRHHVAAGRVVYTHHAQLRIGERAPTAKEILHVLTAATTVRRNSESSWRIDARGTKLVLIVAITDAVVTITVMWKT